ncbi:MAG: prepilin-type N-terminal cleavage/methylation domain-containing protein [Firmicutes bacterium]|nr:prepilin-type N-terminal cleavage/methylation domain-containing protein [Bacillota bacterium]
MLKNLQAKLKDQKGFSLVELIVVIAIMVILIAMLVPNVVGYIKKANWATEQNGASTVFSAAQTYVTDYYAKYGQNPTVPTLEALKDANLLTKAPAINYSIYLATNADAAVDYVAWSSKNSPDGNEGRYPIN